jgi:Zn-dependent M28 family amino/carboxypeptidase
MAGVVEAPEVLPMWSGFRLRGLLFSSLFSSGWALALPLAALLLPETARAASLSDLLAQVSQSNVQSHIAALEGDRSGAASQAAAASYLDAQLTSYGYAVSSQPVAGSENVIAVLAGESLPEQVFVLGAHFDTEVGTPGADDNASGVAAVLEVARLLAGERIDASVHFVLFALEEAGYQGSAAYAAALSGAGADVIGMMSLDMIGYTCSTPGCQLLPPDIPGCFALSGDVSDVGTQVGVGANAASQALLDNFVSSAGSALPSLEVMTFVVEGAGECFPDSRRSDHRSFWDAGVPAIVVTDGGEARNPNYHQPTDTLATLDLAFATDATRAVLANVATYAGLVETAPTEVPTLLPLWRLALAGLLAITGCRVRRR